MVATHGHEAGDCAWSKLVAAPSISVREAVSRIRRTGATYGFSLVLVLVGAAAITYLFWPHDPSLKNWAQAVQQVMAIGAASVT